MRSRIVLSRIGGAVSGAPVSVGATGLLWVLAVVTGSWRAGPPSQWAAEVSSGVRTVGDGRWWTLWTSGLFASGWAHYVVASIVLLGVAVFLGGVALLATRVIARAEAETQAVVKSKD